MYLTVLKDLQEMRWRLRQRYYDVTTSDFEKFHIKFDYNILEQIIDEVEVEYGYR